MAQAELIEAAALLNQHIVEIFARGEVKKNKLEDDYTLPPTEEYKIILAVAIRLKHGKQAEKAAQKILDSTTDIEILSIVLMSYLDHRCKEAPKAAPKRGLPAVLPPEWSE